MRTKDYVRIGMMVSKQEPERARAILALPVVKAEPVDYARIGEQYRRFKAVYEPDKGRGGKSTHDKLFLALTLHFYQPDVYSAAKEQFKLNNGLLKAIGGQLGLNKDYLSKLARIVVFSYKNRGFFRSRVDTLKTQLNNG